MWGKLVRLGIKSGIAYSAIYYSVEQGIWSESEKSVELYGKLYNLATPYVSDTIKEIPIDVELPDLMKTEDISNYLRNTWNKSVMATFRFIGDLPENSIKWSQEYSSIAYDKISEVLENSQK